MKVRTGICSLALGTAMVANTTIAQECCVHSQTASFTPSLTTPQTYDQFGKSIVISGDILAVGEHAKNIGTADVAGEVQIYQWSATQQGWTFLQSIRSDAPADPDQFGHDVDMDGDYLIIGANGHDRDDTQDGAGKAEIFEFNSSTGLFDTPPFVLFPDVPQLGEDDGEEFGHSVAIDGDWAIVTSHKYDADTSEGIDEHVGRAYVFHRVGSDWTQVQMIPPPVELAGKSMEFGWSVAMDGRYAVIGAPADPTPEGAGNDPPGYAFVYRRDATGTYVRDGAALQADVPTTDDRFGKSVDIKGTLVAVGTPGSDLAGTNNGAVYVFSQNPLNPSAPAWVQDGGAVLPCDPGRQLKMGWSVSLSGNLLAAGSSERKMPYLATAQVFRRNTIAQWEVVHSVEAIEGSGESHKFGWDVAISGDRFVVCDPGFDSSSSAVDQWKGAIFSLVRDYSARPSCACPADLDLDYAVGMDDVTLLMASWGTCQTCWGSTGCESCPGDLDKDGDIDEVDLLAMLNSFGTCGCEPFVDCDLAPQSLFDCFTQYIECPRLCTCIEAILQLGSGN